ncbi:MAG: PAS domain S-box protein [Anaerolineae bacterium]|nr:PAS domain S-box protein [Anaerolineae bacterium]
MMKTSEDRYRSIIDDQPDVIRRFLPDGTITFANDAYCNFFKRRKDLLVGDNLFHMVSKEVEDSIRQSLSDLTPENPVKTYERLVQLRDGELRWVQWIDRAIFDEKNNVLEYQSTGRDITDLKNTQHELSRRNSELAALNAIVNTLIESRDLKQMLEAALEKALAVIELDGGWIYLVQEDHNKIRLVQAAQRGLREDSPERSLEIFLEDGLDASDPEYFSRCLATTVNAFHHGYLASILDFQPWMVSAPLQGRDQVLGVLGGYCKGRKITSQQEEILTTIARQIGVTVENIQLVKKNSEIAVIQEVNRIRSELIANVSHEMKTPLGLITIMATSLLREEVKLKPEMRRQLLRDIHNEAGKLNEIVDNLLSISSVEARKERLQKEDCNLERLVQRAIRTLSAQASDHRIVVDFPDRPFVIKVEEGQIEQVVRNLLSNAVKYSPPGSTISIFGDQIDNDVVIKIKDEGIGIPAYDIPHIFERFFRVDDERVKQSAGVGLGLSICKEIVEAHGGRIWVESALGMGSTFYFSLPYYSQ